MSRIARSVPFHLSIIFLTVVALCNPGQTEAQSGSEVVLIVPDRVFDGEDMHDGWVVVVDGSRIVAAGPPSRLRTAAGIRTIELPGATLLPGLIEGHAHLLLHPYDETAWNDQVLIESRAERVARAVNHAAATLHAGFTTVRDLGSEGAGYDDVGLRDAIRKGVIPGPRLLVAGPAIVATGSYGPKGFREGVTVPLGAQPADGVDELIRVTREQIGGGADFIKIYADYRWGAAGDAQPTFLEDEIERIVQVAASSGRPTVAHAATEEGMRRAIMAGVETIEHGDSGTPELFALMAEKGVVWYPTLAAVESILAYGGWNKGVDQEPARIGAKKRAFRAALDAGVEIGMGGDVGVYTHGTNALEMELMVEYGMDARSVLRSATSLNADTFHIGDRVGRIEEGYLADLVAVYGNPLEDMTTIRNVVMVMQEGRLVTAP